MVKLMNVKKQYPQFNLDCSFEVKENRITALIGPNGAGKSTAFKAILGLIHPEGGEIEIFGKNRNQITAHDKAQIGVALSDSYFSGYLRIKDIIPVIGQSEDVMRTERE